MKKPKKSKIKLAKSYQSIMAGIVILAAIGIGIHYLLSARAASPFVSIEAESGQRSGAATPQTDTNASGGSYVQFGNAPSTGTTSLLRGLFDSSQQPSIVQSDAAAIGLSPTAIDAMTVYTDGTSWSSIAGYQPPSTSMRLLLGVDMNPGGTTPTSVPSNLSTFKTLAQTLVSSSHANTILRIGWEWSGNWYPWDNCGPTNCGPTAYVTAFDDIVTTMRAVPGQQFTFDWCANAGSTPTSGTYAQWYPGDAYVDYIGTDHYENPSDGSTSQITSEWDSQLNATGGLAYTAAFAAARGKMMSVPEWGVNGNNYATFVDLMSAFVHNPANKVGYEAYFNDTGPDASDFLTDFPAAKAAFVEDFNN